MRTNMLLVRGLARVRGRWLPAVVTNLLAAIGGTLLLCGAATPAPAADPIVYDNCHDPVIDTGSATFPPTPPPRAHARWEPKNGKIFHGYTVGIQPGSDPAAYRRKLADYVALAGAAPAMTNLSVYTGDGGGPYPDWSAPGYGKSVDVIHACGMIPIVTFLPMNIPVWPIDNRKAWQLADILSGAHDPWLIGMAQSLKATAKPVLFVPLPAMNIWQWPWGLGGGWKPADYLAVYQHILDIFRKEGADNVAFCFGPDMTAGDHDWQSYLRFYPGDAAVDFVAPSISNKIPPGGMDWILRHLAQKPVLYADWYIRTQMFRWYCPSGQAPDAGTYTWQIMEYSLKRWPTNMTGLVFSAPADTKLGGTDAASQAMTTEYVGEMKNSAFLNGPIDWKNLDPLLYTGGESAVAHRLQPSAFSGSSAVSNPSKGR